MVTMPEKFRMALDYHLTRMGFLIRMLSYNILLEAYWDLSLCSILDYMHMYVGCTTIPMS